MGVPESSSHLYHQALQLKLYQAFIFSIPILFSIILFLLFYLFYLKRRVSSFSIPQDHPPPLLPVLLLNPTSSTTTTLNDHQTTTTSFLPSISGMGLKGELKDRLTPVLFDEDLRSRDSQCCVCLGEFEMKEELNQVASCKHVFHVECINKWLIHSNNTTTTSTCPLCRCSVIVVLPAPSTPHGSGGHPQPPPPPPIYDDFPLQQQQQHQESHVLHIQTDHNSSV